MAARPGATAADISCCFSQKMGKRTETFKICSSDLYAHADQGSNPSTKKRATGGQRTGRRAPTPGLRSVPRTKAK
jgi:hypothetical protein